MRIKPSITYDKSVFNHEPFSPNFPLTIHQSLVKLIDRSFNNVEKYQTLSAALAQMVASGNLTFSCGLKCRIAAPIIFVLLFYSTLSPLSASVSI